MTDTGVYMIMRAIRPLVRPTRLLLVAVCFALGAAACGGDDSESGSDADTGPTTTVGSEEALEPVAGGKLVVGLAASTDGWVPAANRWTPSGLNVARAVFDPLAAFTAEGDVVPYLAKSIEPNEDFTEWTIELREGATFHNDDPVDAEAVKANLDSIKASALLGATFQTVEEVTAVDPLTVKVSLTHPWTTFDVLVAQQPGFIVHPAMISGEITDPVGSGPFVFEEWVPGSRFVARANDSYWREGLPYLNEVEFVIIEDDSSRETALLAADVDIMHTGSTGAAMSVIAGDSPDGYYGVWSEGADDEQLIMLNSQAGPTADVEVRRALNLALDRGAMNDALYGGAAVVADTSYAEGSRWYSDPGWAEPDLEAATEMIADWEAANGPLVLKLLSIARTEDLAVAQYIQEAWVAAGADVEIESTDEATFALRMVTGDYETAQFALFNSPDPDGDYNFLDPDNITDPGMFSLAIPRYESSTLEDSLDAGRSTLDLEERQAAYADVYEELAENVPMIWLYHSPWVYEARDNVRGLETFTLPDSDETPLLVNWGSIFFTEAWVG